MPQLITPIDEIAASLGRPVLMLRFGKTGDGLLSPELVQKRAHALDRLRRAGVAFHPCAPPSTSGWESYLGDVYFDDPAKPGDPAYERIVEMFEPQLLSARDCDIRLCIYVGE